MMVVSTWKAKKFRPLFLEGDEGDDRVVGLKEQPLPGRGLEDQQGEDELQERPPDDRAPVDGAAVAAEEPCQEKDPHRAEGADELRGAHECAAAGSRLSRVRESSSSKPARAA